MLNNMWKMSGWHFHFWWDSEVTLSGNVQESFLKLQAPSVPFHCNQTFLIEEQIENTQINTDNCF